jgi:hypothetical protein
MYIYIGSVYSVAGHKIAYSVAGPFDRTNLRIIISPVHL